MYLGIYYGDNEIMDNEPRCDLYDLDDLTSQLKAGRISLLGESDGYETDVSVILFHDKAAAEAWQAQCLADWREWRSEDEDDDGPVQAVVQAVRPGEMLR